MQNVRLFLENKSNSTRKIKRNFNYFCFFLKTIDLTGASDSEIEEEEVVFLGIVLPKVPPPRLDVTQELIVVDEWPETTPAPMPTAMKDMFLPVFSSSCFSLF